MDRRQHFSLWYFIGAMAILLVQGAFFGRNVQTLAYSDFKTLVTRPGRNAAYACAGVE